MYSRRGSMAKATVSALDVQCSMLLQFFFVSYSAMLTTVYPIMDILFEANTKDFSHIYCVDSADGN